MRRKETRREVRKKPSQKKSSVGVMDIILIIVGISLLLFTAAMIKLFREYGAVPDTLSPAYLRPSEASAALWVG